jgi:DNA end-binding protein Ku
LLDIQDRKNSKESLELAETLIASKSAKFEPGKFQDGYEIAVKELVDAKLKHLPVPKDDAPRVQPGNVVNLMNALRKSLSTGARSKSVPPRSL